MHFLITQVAASGKGLGRGNSSSILGLTAPVQITVTLGCSSRETMPGRVVMYSLMQGFLNPFFDAGKNYYRIV